MVLYTDSHEAGWDTDTTLAQRVIAGSAAEAAHARDRGVILSISPHIIFASGSTTQAGMHSKKHATSPTNDNLHTHDHLETNVPSTADVKPVDNFPGSTASEDLGLSNGGPSNSVSLKRILNDKVQSSGGDQIIANQQDERAGKLADTVVDIDPHLVPDTSLTSHNISITPDLLLSEPSLATVDIDVTPGHSSPNSEVQGELNPASSLMPTFTDPLRRPTLKESEVIDTLPMTLELSAEHASDGHIDSPQLESPDILRPTLDGLQLYERQRLFFSMACRLVNQCFANFITEEISDPLTMTHL